MTQCVKTFWLIQYLKGNYIRLKKDFYYVSYNVFEQCPSSDSRAASQGPNLLSRMITPASPTCPIRLYPAARAAQSLSQRLRVSCQGHW